MSEQHYQDYPVRFSSKGVVARYAFDEAPDETYFNLQNLEVRQENALSSRLGRTVINTDGTNNLPLADANIHTLAHMRGLVGNSFRYTGAGQNIYRRSGDATGAFTKLNPTLLFSGNRFSTAQYRPDFSAAPWIFFCG